MEGRRRGRWIGLAAGLALAWLAGPCASEVAAEHVGRVVFVADGDTVLVELAGRERWVRLAEIDAPELDQAYGEAARRALHRLVGGARVRIGEVARDDYGRIVARVHCNGLDVNAELVRLGYAWVYRRYARDPALFELEYAARAARRGLWARDGNVPPWRYRRRR